MVDRDRDRYYKPSITVAFDTLPYQETSLWFDRNLWRLMVWVVVPALSGYQALVLLTGEKLDKLPDYSFW
jgi:hypothetical protein